VTAFLDALVFPHGLDSLSDGCANVLLGIDSTALACHACEYDRGAACLARCHALYPSVPPAFAELHLTNRVQQAGACVPEAGTHA